MTTLTTLHAETDKEFDEKFIGNETLDLVNPIRHGKDYKSFIHERERIAFEAGIAEEAGNKGLSTLFDMMYQGNPDFRSFVDERNNTPSHD